MSCMLRGSSACLSRSSRCDQARRTPNPDGCRAAVVALDHPRQTPGIIHRTGAEVIGVRGYLSGCILALAACIGLAVPVLAQDNSGLAAGKEAWARASCSNCHGSMAQGGDGGDYPVGPGLRNITYGKETMVGIVSCGIPGTPPMPAWLKGASPRLNAMACRWGRYPPA